MIEPADSRSGTMRCKVGPEPVLEQSTDDAAKLDDDSEKRPLRCKICGTVITFSSLAITMAGSHAHVFTNPAGFTYEIGCFSRAPGCAVAGTPTAEHSWFPGYAWSFALCDGCFNHLGWQYTAGAEEFFGLIRSMLTEGDA